MENDNNHMNHFECYLTRFLVYAWAHNTLPVTVMISFLFIPCNYQVCLSDKPEKKNYEATFL